MFVKRLLACAAFLLAVATPAAAFQNHPNVLQRFLDRGEEPPVEYRALRHLEANNPDL